MKYTAAVALVLTAAMAYIAGANASMVSNAIYVAHVTNRPIMSVLDPLHRSWLKTAVEVSTVPPVPQDDEELSRAVESERG